MHTHIPMNIQPTGEVSSPTGGRIIAQAPLYRISIAYCNKRNKCACDQDTSSQSGMMCIKYSWLFHRVRKPSIVVMYHYKTKLYHSLILSSSSMETISAERGHSSSLNSRSMNYEYSRILSFAFCYTSIIFPC